MADPKQKPRSSPVRRFLRSPLLAPFNQPDAWDRLAGLVAPSWSVAEPRARVVRVVDEAPDVRSVWLKPNRRFGAFRAGQHVAVELEIEGARQLRCFSLSAAPRGDRLIRLTVKRKAGGAVSAAMHALKPGDVLRLGQPGGDFRPRTDDGALLLLGAGSGMTPLMSVLHGLADAGSGRDIVLMQCARSMADVLFADEWPELARRLPGLRVVTHLTSTRGRLDAAAFDSRVADWRDREALLCGPDGFMTLMEALYSGAGLRERLQTESFGRRAAPVEPGAAMHAVQFEDTGRDFTVAAGQTLLDGAEAAGLSPRFGCRRGICRTCQCRKRTGTVLNQLTGQLSGPGEEFIQLCITTPRSALVLDL